MNWQKITFTTHEVALGALDKLLKDLLDFSLKANISMDGVSVFKSKRHNKQVSLFFTPNATIALAPIIASYESSPCSKPDEEAIDFFFFGERPC